MNPIPKSKTFRSKKYLEFIRSQPCILCGCEEDIQAHHTASAGIALRGSDYSAIPVCPKCHHRFDQAGKKGRGIFADGELEAILTHYQTTYAQLKQTG